MSVRWQLLNGQQQAEEQGCCLFCFASQEIVFIIAVAGEFWTVRRYLRSEAAEEFKDLRSFDPVRLQNLKALRGGDDAWKTAAHSKMFSNPQTAKQRQLELLQDYNRKRVQRAATRTEIREQLPADGIDAKTPPKYDDRGLPLFTEDDMNAFHMERYHGKRLFETRPPQEFFKIDADKSVWTATLRLGSQLSDEYKEFISSYLGQAQLDEVKRRKGALFIDGDE